MYMVTDYEQCHLYYSSNTTVVQRKENLEANATPTPLASPVLIFNIGLLGTANQCRL